MKALIKQLILFLVMILAFSAANADNLTNASTHHPDLFSEKLRELENQANGRIGVYTINTANHQKLQYRADRPVVLAIALAACLNSFK